MKIKNSKTKQKPLGDWARKNRPAWTWAYVELAERAGLSLSRTKALCKQFQIPIGYVKRRVRLADGRIRTRKIAVLTPSAVQQFLMRHAGLDVTPPSRKKGKSHAAKG